MGSPQGIFYLNQHTHLIFHECVTQISQALSIPIITPHSFQPKNNHTYIVIGIHDMLSFFEQLQHKYSIKLIILHSEQLTSHFFKQPLYIPLLKRNTVYNWSPHNARELSKMGVQNTGLFKFDYPISTSDKPRTIDLFFCGSRTPERTRTLANIKHTYPSCFCLFDFDWSFADSQRLTQFLIKTKFVINIPYYANSSLETHRINKALACGCGVISYYSADEEMNEQYKEHVHFTTNIDATIANMIAGTLPVKKKGIPQNIPKYKYIF